MAEPRIRTVGQLVELSVAAFRGRNVMIPFLAQGAIECGLLSIADRDPVGHVRWVIAMLAKDERVVPVYRGGVLAGARSWPITALTFPVHDVPEYELLPPGFVRSILQLDRTNPPAAEGTPFFTVSRGTS